MRVRIRLQVLSGKSAVVKVGGLSSDLSLQAEVDTLMEIVQSHRG